MIKLLYAVCFGAVATLVQKNGYPESISFVCLVVAAIYFHAFLETK